MPIEQCIDCDQLLEFTSKGWEVVDRFETTISIQYTETKINPRDMSVNRYQDEQVSLYHTRPERVTVFRVRKNEESLLQELNEKVEGLSKYNKDLLEFEADLNRQNIAAKKEIELLKITNSTLTSDRNIERARREQVETIKRHLEQDIGKLREHLGKKTFEEILPPKDVK